MSTCKFINSKGEKCNRKAVKGEDLCSIHKFYLKKHNIDDVSQESHTASPPSVEEVSPSLDINRYRVFEYIKEYNDTYAKPTPSPSSTGMGMEGGLMLLMPLLIKLIPHLMKYFKPNNIEDVKKPPREPPRTPTPTKDETEIDIIQRRNLENDLVPISN